MSPTLLLPYEEVAVFVQMEGGWSVCKGVPGAGAQVYSTLAPALKLGSVILLFSASVSHL